MSGAQLLPRDATTLLGITADVIAERGYSSVDASYAKVVETFPDYQRTTGILIPVCPPDGSNSLYMLRRLRERIAIDRKTGKRRTIKYEMPEGQKHRLDIHPRNRRWLRDIRVPIWITEGIKKGDALTSAGRFAIALGGVDCFKTPECLADWELIELQGRTIIIVFDADAATNENVAGARDRLAAFLAERGARVVILHLPRGANGEKGIDDHLAVGADLVDLLAQYAVPWRPGQRAAVGSDGAEPCPRDDCRATQEQLAELRELQRTEAKIITGRSVPANRVGPYLSLLRRYWSDASPRLAHLAAAPGRPETWTEAEPLVGEDGWASIPLQSWAKHDLGYSYSMMLSARKELVAAGLLEERKRPVKLDDDREIEQTLIRPTSARCYAESVRGLATVVKPASNWGGSRWECPLDPAHKVVTKHVCAHCGVDAVLVPTAEPDPHFQLENAPPAPAAASPAPDFQVENGVVSSSPLPHTSSAETENGPPGDGQASGRAAAKAWGRAALEAARQLGYPALYDAGGRTLLVKPGSWSWEAICHTAPPNIQLIATRIASALAVHEREWAL